jgi:hypothetical protein
MLPRTIDPIKPVPEISEETKSLESVRERYKYSRITKEAMISLA